jgi:hypothetical protein
MSTTTGPGTRDQDDHNVGSDEAAVVHDLHADDVLHCSVS